MGPDRLPPPVASADALNEQRNNALRKQHIKLWRFIMALKSKIRKIIDLYKIISAWENTVILSEDKLKFEYKIDSGTFGRAFIDKIEKKNFDRRNIINRVMAVYCTIYNGVVRDGSVILRRSSYLLGLPIKLDIYYFFGTITENDGTTFISGKLRMKFFPKLVVLSWFNGIFISISMIISILSIKFILFLISAHEENYFKYDVGLLLKMLFAAFLVLLFGYFILFVAKRINHGNRDALRMFFEQVVGSSK